MYYKVVQPISTDRPEWEKYLSWRKLSFTSLDSLDSFLQPDLFEARTAEDWQHCVNEDFKLNLITDSDYAFAVASRYPVARVLGVEIELERAVEKNENLLGYDILDRYCANSLLTNWGKDGLSFINQNLMPNGLLNSFDDAKHIRDRLRVEYPDDDHASHCQIWAVYEVSQT
ncbi:MAG: hypothetical protein ACRBB6_10640 [Neptuniibacter sp.]